MTTTHLINSKGTETVCGVAPDSLSLTDEREESTCEDCNDTHDERAWDQWNESQPSAWARFQMDAERAVAEDIRNRERV